MTLAVFSNHYPEANARPAIALIAQLVEADHFRFPHILSTERLACRYGRDCDQRGSASTHRQL
jgi:hypothetical protein